MEPFLKQIADHLQENYPDSLAEICVVLPNRRAKLFLKSHLNSIISQPIWMPEVFGMEDFIERVSGRNIVSPLTLLFDLYQVHKRLGNTDKTIAEFMRWGVVLLHDFNELDLYNADAQKLFGYLSDLKAIERWHPDEGLSTMESGYLKFFASLSSYYKGLNENLSANNKAYQGSAFRYVAENIASLYNDLPWKKIVFAGFNALSTTEKTIISFLELHGLAESIYDADAYYLNDKRQEAGVFLRDIKERQKDNQLHWVEDNMLSPKKINVISTVGKIAMAKAAGKILEEELDVSDLRDTALVLVDEGLLIPAISAIPANTGAYNVTMGYPFNRTAAADLLNVLLSLYAGAEKLSVERKREPEYYFRDLVSLFQHPYVIHYLKICGVNYQQIIKSFISQNRVFYTFTDIDDIFKKMGFSDHKISDVLPGSIPKTPLDALHNINELIVRIRETADPEQKIQRLDKYELEFLFQAHLLVNKMEELVVTYRDVEDLQILRALLQQMTAEIRIPFIGEPLSGLQVMGMLETRTLDFKNVIMLSVNEGLIPVAKSYQSLIPFELKREFGMPVYREKNAVYAYHFYRLLQRAENVWMFYDTQAEAMGSGEGSRFIQQLIEELPRVNPQAEINIQTLSEATVPKPWAGIQQIQKSEEIIKKMGLKAQKGFSPSALNIYKSCTLRYYFSQILDVQEPEDVEENIDSREFGNAIHKTLELLYKPYIKVELVSYDFEDMKAKAKSTLELSLADKFSKKELGEGQNFLAMDVALKYVYRQIAYDKSVVEAGNRLMVKGLEERMQYACTIPEIAGLTPQVIFKGFADRVDELNGITRVLDYKTGFVKLNKTGYELQKILDDKKGGLNIPFQLMMYSWLYRENSQSGEIPDSAVWALRNAENPIIPIRMAKETEVANEDIDTFKEGVLGLVKEMFDKELPFEQTENDANCTYCPYRESICMR